MKTSGQGADGAGLETWTSGMYRRITQSITEFDFVNPLG